MREEAEAVVEELQTRPRTGTALDELAADLDEVQETLAEESERRQAAEAALAAKGGWSADLDRIRDAEARAEALGRELEDARLKAAALQAELDATRERCKKEGLRPISLNSGNARTSSRSISLNSGKARTSS